MGFTSSHSRLSFSRKKQPGMFFYALYKRRIEMNGLTYLPLEQAVDILLSQLVQANRHELLSLFDAIDRVAFEDISARITQPPFDRSPLDGYAVLHTDIQTATENSPVALCVAQHIFAGEAPQYELHPGEAARIMTGAPIPPGATCVIRQEDTDRKDDMVQIKCQVGAYQNYCRKGEDVEYGEIVIHSGEHLDASRIAILAGQGFADVNVFIRPEIGVMSTGSELVPLGQLLETGKIYDSNRYYIASRIRQLGGKVIYGESTADDPEQLAQAVDELLAKCGLVITTGGVSVGAHDYMPAVAEMLKANELFGGIQMKPGSPAKAYIRGEKIFLCLSGNPFAAAATFELLARPIIKKLCGEFDLYPIRMRSYLKDSFPKASHERRFIRAKMAGDGVHLPRGGHASGIMSSMAGCNCFVDIPAGTPPLEVGAEVEVVLFQED